jgi:hypothetical protein
MQVYVEHFLARSFAISHKEVYTLAFQTAPTKGRIDALGPGQRCSRSLPQLIQLLQVYAGWVQPARDRDSPG